MRGDDIRLWRPRSACQRTGGVFFMPHEPQAQLTRQSIEVIGSSR